MKSRGRAIASGAAIIALAGACTDGQRPAPKSGTPEARTREDAAAPVFDASAVAEMDASSADASAEDAATVVVSTDPMEPHQTTREGLLSLFTVKDDSAAARAFLEKTFGPDNEKTMSQGNKKLARHRIDKAKCLDGLKSAGIVVQTAEQRAKCNGYENMVPVWKKEAEPTFCIDVFEFPNKTCELPMVFTPPTQAKKVCELQGKRLCADLEWNLACKGDPEGGADRRYAYGDRLDLDACNMNLGHRTSCDAAGPASAWRTCSTDTEPSGAYPKCRSRFGVFDQHGNVAEVMTRKDGNRTVTQLKGSAWFYVELAKEPGEPPLKTTIFKATAHPDHCNFDPRWHVEPIEAAIHTNYHLGFRCCRTIDGAAGGKDAGAP